MALEDDILNRNRRVPAAPPRVSPLAAEINQQVRRPGGISQVANQFNQRLIDARSAPARAATVSSPITNPAYRSGAPLGQPQFVQTPTPSNPSFRAAPAVAPAAAPRIAASVAQAEPAARGGRALPALAVGLEALNVAQAGRDGGAAAAGGEAIAAGGRLGAAAVGARASRAIPLPASLRPLAPVAGGIAGYALGQQGVDALRESTPEGLGQVATLGTSIADNATATNALRAAANPSTARTAGSFISALAGQAGADIAAGRGLRPTTPTATLIEPGSDIAPPARRGAASQPASGNAQSIASSMPEASGPQAVFVDPDNPRTQPPSTRVVGNWNGRDITETQANTLANQLNGGTGAGMANGNPTGVSALAAPIGPAGRAVQRSAGTGAVGAVIGAPGSSTAEQIDKQIAGLGPLNMRSKRDLVGQLLGLRVRAEEGVASRAQSEAISQAELAQRADASALSADIDRERIAASTAQAGRGNQQTLTGADGTVYSVGNGLATPVQIAGGQTLTAPTKSDTTTQQIAARILESTLPIGATPEQINAAVQNANAAAQAIASGETPAPSAPASRADFIKQAKAANPGATDAQLGAYYDQNYGKKN